MVMTAAHFDQGLAELQQALGRLRTPEGVAAGLAAALRPVAARLLAEASESSASAERQTYLLRLGEDNGLASTRRSRR